MDQGVAPHQGIDAIYARFSEGYKKLDPAMVANLYTENAAYLAPTRKSILGGKSWRVLPAFFDSVWQKNGRLEISFRFQRQVEQNLAYDVGIFNRPSFGTERRAARGKGKFMAAAKPDKEGVWRFQVDGV